MDKRSERMLEEILKQPGNEKCADCKVAAPRWASVSLGVFLCHGCATHHRKLGTHTSRVKSVTLDTWSREHLSAMRQMGNIASNAIWNPDERRNPPPTTLSGSDDRDGEMEKFIRRKYEQGAFKAGANPSRFAAPTSMNRARAAAGLPVPAQGMTRSSSWTNPNPRNPELNDVLFSKEKDLPRIPKQQNTGSSGIANQNTGPAQPPRPRPIPSRAHTPQSTGNSAGGSLIDMGEGTSATAPLQMAGQNIPTMGSGFQSQVAGPEHWGGGQSSSPFQQQQQYYPSQQYPPQNAFSAPSQSSFSPQPYPAHHNPFGSSYNPQMAFQQPPQSMGFQQQSYLPIPQQQQQYGGQMLGVSPNSMGQMGYGGMGSSPGHIAQGNGSWQGHTGMNAMGTVYGQQMR